MPIISKDEVKTFLDIPEADTSKDAKIELLIPEVEKWLKGYLNDPMKDEDGNDSYPDGIKFPFSQLLNYDIFYRNKGIGVNSEHLADYAVTYDFRTTNGYPAKILELVNPFLIPDRKVTFI
ncbi:MAG TPA: phage head-tail connector protein [Ignavibacteriales bacterium]|nr:phage head-tail connector protein [Ignavibacteriales bacterium]